MWILLILSTLVTPTLTLASDDDEAECLVDRDCAHGEVCFYGYCVWQDSCSWENAPVCGLDGYTYFNECFATQAGVEVAHDGPCHPEDECPDTYAPVCGLDDNTYPNECLLIRQGVGLAYEGVCQGDFAACDHVECPENTVCKVIPINCEQTKTKEFCTLWPACEAE